MGFFAFFFIKRGIVTMKSDLFYSVRGGMAFLALVSGVSGAGESNNTSVQQAVAGKQSYEASPMGSIFGPNHFDKDFGFTVGLKAWANQWDMPLSVHSAHLLINADQPLSSTNPIRTV
ncbi:hypothetical protein CCP4SC76_1220004 [Gammaproteobacteria bacterium]